jgi:hypothetical protein
VSSSLKFTGMAEFRAELSRLAETLRAQGEIIVREAAEQAAAEIRAAYPRKTGNLKAGVKVAKGNGGRFGTVYVVRNVAPHAFIYENGTMVRRSAFGNRGAMPPGHVFVPIIARRRRRMDLDLIAMVNNTGLVVTAA